MGGIDPLENGLSWQIIAFVERSATRDEIVIKKVLDENVPITLLLSGGYAPTLKETVLAHAVKTAMELAHYDELFRIGY